jgi:hypothetical protein
MAGPLLAFLLLGLPVTARAYPQWQLSSGASRCSTCHYAPAGGGLMNDHGRAAASELSTWPGEGGFLHGAVALPGMLALGFDGRYAAVENQVRASGGGRLASFPMQADAQVRLSPSDAISVQATVGYRGRARAGPAGAGEGAAQAAGRSPFISREHYFTYRPEPLGPYLRLGRFFAPYGLRLSEHNLYVRRDTGFGLLEESYNLSLGVVQDRWEMHLTVFGPDFLSHLGADAFGVAAMYERRLQDWVAVGLDARVGLRKDGGRHAAGVFGKAHFPAIRTLLQAQLDVVHQTFRGAAAGASADLLVSYTGLTVFPLRGLWVTAFEEVRQTNLSVGGTGTTAGGLQVNWFPYPHFEIALQVRQQTPDAASSAGAALAMLHYYL